MRQLLLFVTAILSASAVRAAGAIEPVSQAKSIAVVSAIEPWVHGQKVNILTTAFWLSADPAFDANEAAVSAIKQALNREAQVFSGKEAGFDLRFTDTPKTVVWEEAARARLSALASKWGTDLILIVHGTEATNWISGTSARLRGVGIYRQGPHHVAYSVLALSIFDCRTNRFRSAESFSRQVELPDIDWRDNWLEFSSNDRQTVYETIRTAVAQCIPQLLGKASLATAESVAKTAPKKNFLGKDKPASFVPADDNLAIPGVESLEVARAAVLNAFRQRGWKVTTNTPERIVGVIADGKKEAVETVVLNEHFVVVTATRYELQPDGSRVTIEPHARWHRNLKESIASALLELRPEN